MTRYKTMIVFLISLLPLNLSGQRVDYDAFPRIDVNTIHMELRLNVQDDPLLLGGEVLYTLRLIRSGLEILELDAVRMDVERVEWNGNRVDHRLEDDKLKIEIPENQSTGRDHRLGIRYRAEPEFGVHMSESGTIWSSTLPGSVRHWLPVMDHPRNRFTTDVSLVFSTGKTGVFSGVPGEETAETVDTKRAKFYSDSEIPASSLAFALGRFEQQQITSGRHRIDLYAEEGRLDEEWGRDLLETAREMLTRSAELFRAAYPSRTLSLVILPDDRWELKSYGAGVVFGYESKPDIHHQVAQGVIGQWAGIQLQEERWRESAPLRMLQAWIVNRLQESLPPVEGQQESGPLTQAGSGTVYERYTMDSFSGWREWVRSDEAAPLRRLLDQRIGSLLSDLPSVITWYDFALWSYRQNGLPMMEEPLPELPGREAASEASRYRVAYDLEEGGRLRLRFTAERSPMDELVTVRAVEVTRQERRDREVTFTGSEDEVVFNVSSSIENLILVTPDEPRLEFVIDKPFEFWFHQLRNEEDPQRRKEAAVAMRQYQDNPDLQLALLDVMGQEESEEVMSEMIRTLAAVTGGATGTDQIFRQRFARGQDSRLQLAIVEAYANYPENETIIGQLRSLILNPTSVEVQRQAVHTLSSVADEERFRSMSGALMEDEAARPVVPILLRELAGRDMEAAISQASRFLTPRNSFQLRSEVLDFLLEEDRSASRWEERLTPLLYDRDPRIRYRALEGLQRLPSSMQSERVEERWYEELDERVRGRLEELI